MSILNHKSNVLILKNHKPSTRVIDRNPVSRGVPPLSPARHARPPFMVLPSVAYCFYPPAGMAGGLFPPNGANPVNGG